MSKHKNDKQIIALISHFQKYIAWLTKNKGSKMMWKSLNGGMLCM